MLKGSGIEIRGVGKRYATGTGDVAALEAIDLRIADGEFIAIVGPSGCGKSTLMRLIAGLIPPSEGHITVFGKKVSGPFHDCGIVFQQPILLDWRNVLDNVLFQVDMRGLDIARYRDEAMRLLAQVGLADFAQKRPYELSGGMKQRAAIARALVHDPPLLLMDEPFGALDALTREQMRLDLEQLWMARRKTIVFITHSIDEAVLLADRVVVMSPRPGRIEDTFAVDIPRPRGLNGRRHAGFQAVNDRITRIFLDRGVLKGEAE